mmetsp:Transcript_7007/g.43008  ORF Transcript_7007/g.43008 Transcript_7007/m.43008 type:complete len:214 (+) Transcript_7007:1789-2430(+)
MDRARFHPCLIWEWWTTTSTPTAAHVDQAQAAGSVLSAFGSWDPIRQAHDISHGPLDTWIRSPLLRCRSYVHTRHTPPCRRSSAHPHRSHLLLLRLPASMSRFPCFTRSFARVCFAPACDASWWTRTMFTTSLVHSMTPRVDSFMDVKPHGQATKCRAFMQGGSTKVGCAVEEKEAQEYHGGKTSRQGNNRKVGRGDRRWITIGMVPQTRQGP